MFGFESSDEEDRLAQHDIQPLKVDRLELPNDVFASHGAVYISGLPGCWFRDTHQDIRMDMSQLVTLGITDAIVLVTNGEMRKYRTPALLQMYPTYSITPHHLPFTDGTPPTLDRAMEIMAKIMDLLLDHKKILVHCMCGYGRAGVLGACLLQWLDDELQPDRSIRSMRRLRGSRAIQTLAQYNFVQDFRDNLTRERERSVSR